MLTVLIGGVDRTSMVRLPEMPVEAKLTNEPDVCRFQVVSVDGTYQPQEDDEVLVLDEEGNRLFGGVLNQATESAAGATRRFDCECVDFTVDLDRRLIIEDYAGVTAGDIVRDAIAKANEILPPERQFTANGVQDGPVVTKLSVNRQPVSMLMERLNRLTGYEWYPDYYRDVKFLATETLSAPREIRPQAEFATPGEWFELQIKRGPISQIRTQVTVIGATYEGTETVFREKGDGSKRVFALNQYARNVKVYVDAVGPQLLGLNNVDSGRQWYFDYQGQFIRHDDTEPVLTAGQELQVLYTPLIPVRVVVRDEALVERYGVREHVVQDSSIDSKEVARLRGKLEIRGRAVSGSFKSLVTGWHPGQTVAIKLPARGLPDALALITATEIRYAGNLNRYITTVQFEVI